MAVEGYYPNQPQEDEEEEETKTSDKRSETKENGKTLQSHSKSLPSSCPAFFFPISRPSTDLRGASPRLRELLEGGDVPGESGEAPEAPPWLDRDLFNEGRKFYKKYFFCLAFSELLSLLLVLAEGRVLKPLIHTGRSDTPGKSRRRYFSTLLHLVAWFEGDVWESKGAASGDILSIRRTHTRLGLLLNAPGECEKVRGVTVRSKGHQETDTPLLPFFRSDLRNSGVKCDGEGGEKEKPRVFLSQLDMSLTQYSFMGLILSHPSHLGAAAATEREMAGLVHFWRGLGWLLGIKDEFNFCSGTLDETVALCEEVERLILLPRLSECDYDYEHMVGSLMSGINEFLPMISLPAMLKYLSVVFGISSPCLSLRMTWVNVLQYWLMRVTFAFIYYFPDSLHHLNSWFKRVVRKVEVSDKKLLADYRKKQAGLTRPVNVGL